MKRERRKSGVASVTAAQNSETLRVGDAFLHGPFRAVDDIVQHFSAPLALSCHVESFPVSRGAAKVDLHDGITPVGEELDERVITPGVSLPWTAVNQENGWQPARFHAAGKGEISVKFQPITALE